jgi:rhodanese-related sulfurtransferase
MQDGAAVLDVREPGEFESGHVPDAVHIPLGELGDRLGEVPRGRPIVTYCGSVARSTTAASLLERAGVGPALNLEGGFEAWRKAGNRVAGPRRRPTASTP